MLEEVVQETKLVGDNAEDVHTYIQREPLRLMHKMSNPYLIALLRTPVSVPSGEGPSVPITRQADGAWKTHRGPDISEAYPGSEAPHTYERCRGHGFPDICKR